MEHLDASPVTGQVVDRATHRPIVGAQVTLSASLPDRAARTRSDQDSRFRLPDFRHLEFTPLPYTMYRAPTGYLEIEVRGYRPYHRREFFGSDDGPGYICYDGAGNLQPVRIELDHRSKP